MAVSEINLRRPLDHGDHDADETCHGCGECYQRTGDGKCRKNCVHGILEDAEEVIAVLQLGELPEEPARAAHIVTRLVEMVHAADEVRTAHNIAFAWRNAMDLRRRDEAAAAVPEAFKQLARVMDGRDR